MVIIVGVAVVDTLSPRFLATLATGYQTLDKRK